MSSTFQAVVLGTKLYWSWEAACFDSIPEAGFADAQDMENLGKTNKAFLG